jgi:branched-chain amino acid transport system permease protein
MVRFPRGLWGYVAARFDLHLFPVRRRLALPGGKAHTEDAA